MRFRILAPRTSSLLGGVSVIAAGVGLAGMVFALADPYVSRNLPYRDSGRLVSIGFGLGDPRVGADQGDVPLLDSWQARTDLFDGLAAFDDTGWLRIRLSDRTAALRAVAVTDNMLEVLGLESRLASDALDAWVSKSVATTLSGGELQPGRSMSVLPEGILRVRSILPRSFLLPQANRTESVDVLTVLPNNRPVITIERFGGVTATSALHLVGRMRPDVTTDMVKAALGPSIDAVGSQLSVVSLSTAMTARLQELGRGALLACALIIFVSWMNVFNIALTHGLYRQRELATRAAIGARPSRIARLLSSEALKVAALGSAGALAVAWSLLSFVVRVLPARFATLGVPSLTARMLLLVAAGGAVSCLSWYIASILAWKLGGRQRGLYIANRDGGGIRIVRFTMVAGQVAAANVLFTAATLLGLSYLNLLDIDPGMDEDAATFTVAHDPDLPPALRREVVQRIVLGLRATEGVQAAGAKAGGLLDGRYNGGGLVINGQFVAVERNRVEGHYFAAMGLRFLAGRPPPPEGQAAVITESLAQRHFHGRMPVGEILPLGDRSVPIAGVISDVRSIGLHVEPKLAVYEVGATEWSGPHATYVVRVPHGVWRSADAQRVVRDVDPLAVVLDGRTVGDRLDDSVRDRTFATVVVGLFAIASVLVTAIGLAGVVAYTVAKRTREIAIRLALGATSAGVVRLVVHDAVTAALSGTIGGVIASVWLSSALESLLYRIRPAEPMSLALAASCLLIPVVGAAVVPAIRVATIAPSIALRGE